MKPLALSIGNNALDAPLPTCWFVPCVCRSHRSRCTAAKGGGAVAARRQRGGRAVAARRQRAAGPRLGGGQGRGGRGSAAAKGGGVEVRRREKAGGPRFGGGNGRRCRGAEPALRTRCRRAEVQSLQVQTRRGAEPALRTRCKGAEVQSLRSEPSAEVQRCRTSTQNQSRG